ncbi:MAG: MarR family winged helix-turn-helix transcriptional regulator [Fastidiosipilaceae bacterium]|jgi:DNA-binding MarR family transcriptional regulator
MIVNQMAEKQLETLIQLFKELAGVYRRAVSHIGISENEYWIWYTLTVFDDEYTQQDICALWSLPKQTVNNIITHMVQKNYAVLEVVPNTRNRKIIRLTETGRQYGVDLVTPIYNAEERALDRLNPEEILA